MRRNAGKRKIIPRVLILAGIVISGFLGGVTEAADSKGDFLEGIINNDEIKAKENLASVLRVKEESKQDILPQSAAAGQSENSADKPAQKCFRAGGNIYDVDMNVISASDLSRYKGETIYLEVTPQPLAVSEPRAESLFGNPAPADSALKIKVEFTRLSGSSREEAVSAVQATLISIEDNPVVGYGLENGVLDKILVCEVGVESAQEHPWNLID